MTERTFRTPSPGRPVPRGGPEPAPPVPKLPPNVTKPPPIPTKSQRRTASLDAPPARLVPPPTYKPGVRGQSAQPVSARSPQTASRSPQTSAAALVMRQHRPSELERPDSRNSINFSYPRPQSPPMRSPASPEPLSPISRNGISAAEAERVQYGVTQVAQQPVKKKKKKIAPQTAEGSHLSSGSMGGKPVTTPLEPGPDIPIEAQDPPIKKKKKKPAAAAAATGQTSHFPPSPASTQESDSESTPEKGRRQQRASGQLLKQPSVVREDWEGEQEYEQGVTGAQQREEQGLSPSSDSGRTTQGKKPMTAANMSRKIEEPASATPPDPSTIASAHHAVTEAQPVTQPAQNKLLSVGEPVHRRMASLSPSRSTRFSESPASDLAAGQKHEPLPRSVSPAKSAMKYHSSPGGLVGDAGFPMIPGSSADPSEASDSNVSADGSIRRKKSARVSFEPGVEIVGTAAEPIENDSPTVFSPQHKEQGKKGFFGRSKPVLTTIPSQEELDEHMKPRPQLPSFGSIRGKARRTDSSDSVETPKAERKFQLLPTVNIASSTSTSSDTSSSSLFMGGDQGISTDRAIGSIFARASRKAEQATPTPRDPNLPLPPEVTSVEGSGYVSDTDSDTTVEDNRGVNGRIYANHVTQSKSLEPTAVAPVLPVPVPAQTGTVPALALQPPTPGMEQENPTDQWAIEVPGGFPASTDELSRTADAAQDTKRTGLGIEETPTTHTAASKLPEPQPVDDSDVEASDHDSIYSDAAEDLSDTEGDGFLSIDAVVESPVVESPRARLTSPPSSPLAERPQGGARTTSWDEAQQRWSGIAQQSRQATVAHPSQPPQPVQSILTQSIPKKKKKKSAAAIAAASAPVMTRGPPPESPPKSNNQMSPYPMIDSTNHNSGSFRQSMRGPQPPPQNEGPTMRHSMRAQAAAQPEPGFRQSMRTQAAAGPPAIKSRPKSMPAPPPSPPPQQRAALQKRHIPPAATSPKAAPKKPAAKLFSNDSDSESSFRKSRRSKSSGGAYTMRTSMRAGASEAPSKPAGRGTVRSLSPPQRRPFSPPPEQKAFRSSMRSSLDTGAPTLRGQPEQKRSLSLFGRSRKTKSPTPAPPLPVSAAPRSRIVDSDDGDAPRRQTFRSRFYDSSDEEEDDKSALRPVRGIPRKKDDSDSTDLEDSSDEEPKQKATAPPKINTAIAAAPSADEPRSPTTMKKKGLFSRFRSKKEKDDSSKSRLGVGTIGERDNIMKQTAPAIQNAKKDHDDDDEEEADGAGFENMGFGSAAERDAMIAQTMAKLEAAKATNSQEPNLESVPESPPPASPAVPRIQRRITPQRFASDSWPLPPKIGALDHDDGRPSTADPVGLSNSSSMRPGLGERVPTSETLKTDGGTPIVGRNGKKKRFPLLRKAFGLKD